MSNIHNPKNVIGMADLLADDNEDIDIDEIEKSITTGVISKKPEKPIDIAQEYSKEIEDLGRRFNIKPLQQPSNAYTSNSNAATSNSNTYNPPSQSYSNQSYSIQSQPAQAQNSSIVTQNSSITAELDELLNWQSNDADDEPTINYHPNESSRPSWSMSDPEDTQLSAMTNEERKQTHLSRVLSTIDKSNDDAAFLDEEDEEDEMARILEQIDLLKTNLENEGVNLSRIPDIQHNSSKKEAKAVLKILQIKNDRLRYCDFFEEGVLAMAYGLEGVFNGEREILGSKIDLTGYSDTVKVKLRRMRYDTSSFVSGIMKGYSIGSGWRIILELVPSLFLYSRDRRLKAKDNLISDDAYKKAMQDLA